MKPDLDLYTDYLLSSFGQTTATGLAQLLDDSFSHDRVTDFLNESDYSSKALWKEVKPFVRKMQSQDGVMIVDDIISHKPHSQINGLVCSYYDHASNAQVRGINFVSLLYWTNKVRVPVDISIVTKTWRCELHTRQESWKSETTKNEMFRSMLKQAHQNQIPFWLVIADSWYTNAANINAVLALGKHYLGAIKSNTSVALSKQDRAQGKFIAVSKLKPQPGTLLKVYLRSVDQEVIIVRDIFINKDGSEGELLLLCTDTRMTYQQIISTYQKRWEVEDYHKSLKQNASLEKSPAYSVRAQSMHLFCSVCAFVKLEKLKLVEKLNHFAIKTRLYIGALKAAWEVLKNMQLHQA
jgi:hypothetical protein